MSVTVRNVLGTKVRLWWGLLAPGHSQDEEFSPSSLSLALWGGQQEETPAKFNAVISVKG